VGERAGNNRCVAWFKLIGSSENPIPEYWDRDRPDLLSEVRFPWNKPPSDIWRPGKLIIYAVGAGTLVAIQSVTGAPQVLPRRGAPGSADQRWPHKLAVTTDVICSPTSKAPNLHDLAPEFAARHRAKFRNGSHWKIEVEEYDELAALIVRAGVPSTASA
jgi:hypothetical protein